ncbi:MAG: alanine racemase, partial [Eubacterium sp.]|nr:alanine racemase [Eubacterium sp.]
LSHVEIEGLFSHFARADEKNIEPVKEPFARYEYFLQLLEQEGIRIPIKHMANSASIMRFPEAHMSMVRSGITTYGLYPSEEVEKSAMELHPAMEWKAVVSYVKEVEPGTPISYGGTYVSKRKEKIATIPVGYADGLKRDLSNKGRVLIRGEYAPIVGRICMDQFMVDVTEVEGVSVGDEVTIFGHDGDKFIPVEEIAELSHSFNYEYVCGITGRVPRSYMLPEEMK